MLMFALRHNLKAFIQFIINHYSVDNLNVKIQEW